MVEALKKTSSAGASGPGDAIDAAWRIHGAILDWTGKVDAKANFCLAAESALLVIVVNLSAQGRGLANLENPVLRVGLVLGAALVACGILCAATVVIPRLRRRNVDGEVEENFIYFGHARQWAPEQLAARLDEGNLLPVISRQIVTMSKIAWRKHVMVQYSLTLALIGAALIGVCVLAQS